VLFVRGVNVIPTIQIRLKTISSFIPMTILSIDVGIRNLALCLLDEDHENLVREWDVDGIPPQHADGVYVSLRNST